MGVSTLVASDASAQTPVNFVERHCTAQFLSACATLNYVDFSNSGPGGTGVLRIIVSNTSSAADEPGAYIRKLYFDMGFDLPPVQEFATAQYGAIAGGVFQADGRTEQWKAKNEGGKSLNDIPGFRKDLKLDDNADPLEGGDGNLTVGVGEAVMVTIAFQAPLPAGAALVCMDTNTCQGWTAEMKGMGPDGKGKGLTTTPEPSTWLLMASGFVLLAIAGRRRRRDLPQG